MKKTVKLLALLLSVCLLFASLPLSASAAPVQDVQYNKGGAVIVNSDGSIAVYPDPGYQLSSFLVNGRSVSGEVIPGGMIVRGLNATDKVRITFGVRVSKFSDVRTGAYYTDAVDWAVDNGITAGTGKGKFSPNGRLTRAQVVTFLWRLAGEPEPRTASPFADVSRGEYYYKAVVWANENDIVYGTSAHGFSPLKTCSRGDMVTFLWRYYGWKYGYHCPFTDVNPNAYYGPAVAWAYVNGIASGTGKNKFSPKSPCTRGMGVTFLYNAVIVNGRYPDPSVSSGSTGGTTGGSTGGATLHEDNDQTYYTPSHWSWIPDGTEGYGLDVFTSGKYVREDGRAVLYIESSDSPQFFSYQLFAMAEGAHQEHWYDPSPQSVEYTGSYYSVADVTAYGDASGVLTRFRDNGRHAITVTSDFEEEMYIFYGSVDGVYYLVREKK